MIRQHLFLVVQLRVGAEVVRKVCGLSRLRPIECRDVVRAGFVVEVGHAEGGHRGGEAAAQ